MFDIGDVVIVNADDLYSTTYPDNRVGTVVGHTQNWVLVTFKRSGRYAWPFYSTEITHYKEAK